MANKRCVLPKGSSRLTKVGYEEVYVPAVRHKPKDQEKLVPIAELPEWARPAFPPPIERLNYIQSRLYKAAFTKPENLLVCAPTGAGKTNIALLSVL
jgi:pre-mRNA-splicing helicase BRR2